ncbi:hypothetical protein NKH89_22970 [Mesorhizobium sp. M0923]|uniref:hypothetical protein n=2 Tax=unclassified Mesorhizobium TaxID=325217 RepID=UPI0033377895
MTIHGPTPQQTRRVLMPGNDLQVTGGITQALLDALNQIHTAVAAQLVNPDGTPSGSAVYMHLPVGQPIDPKMYANPWTPAGGSAYGAVSTTGAFSAPPAPPSAGTPATPAGQLAAMPAPDPRLQLAISSAFNTAQRVDDMLMVTNKGVAVSWPQRTVSIEYFTALAGMQAEPIPEPSTDIKKRIADAQKTLYLMDADGNFTGYTPRHTAYRHNQKVLADARSEFALAYSQAMSDPIQGQAWPVTSARYQNAVDQAYNDFKDMGGQQIDDAIATLQSVGGSAAAALIAKARKMYDEYSVGLGGAVAIKVPWSYIDPVSWWDHTNHDFGVMKITATSKQYQASGGGGQHSFGHSFYNNESSSTSGSVGYSVLGFGASANASHSETSHNDGWNADQSSWQSHQDSSSSATVTFEWFMASIERPWLLGDLFHMDGWYLAGQKKNAISDGTIEGQIGDVPKLLPMIPKGFLIVRNVKITANSWGSMGSAFQSAVDSASGHTESSSTSYGGKVGWCGIGGSVQHSNSDSSGAFSNQHDASQGFSFSSNEHGGTLELFGSQIVGWVGQIQPAAPRKDDPALSAEVVANPATAANAGVPAIPADAPAAPQG